MKPETTQCHFHKLCTFSIKWCLCPNILNSILCRSLEKFNVDTFYSCSEKQFSIFNINLIVIDFKYTRSKLSNRGCQLVICSMNFWHQKQQTTEAPNKKQCYGLLKYNSQRFLFYYLRTETAVRTTDSPINRKQKSNSWQHSVVTNLI